ncbi:MAG: amidohydrolase family protein [Gammaproteobacteria bacterium]|nr:amidohydrolase family protein [Gammaproteobacteria bacterium]
MLCAILFYGMFSPAVAGDFVVHAGRLIDGKSDQVRSSVSIVIANNEIAAVQQGFIQAGPGQEVIDLRDYTVMPGFMDMHTHIYREQSPRAFAERFNKEPADFAFPMIGFARKTLMAGFTTVRDLGDRYNLSVSLRNAIDAGVVDGPRIYTAAKSIGSTGGHADPTNGQNSFTKGDPGPKEGVINGPDDAAKAVRQRYKDGADLIKITATGGVLSVAKSGMNPQFTEEEIRAIVDTAKDYDFHVAAHAHGTEGMKRAIRGGVRSIEHGTFMDDDVIRLMKRNGTFYVPTISAGKWVYEKAKIDGFFPEIVRPKALSIGPQIEETFARAYRAGVRIAFGTDSGVSSHGDNAREFTYMVGAGMPAMAAIKSATSVAAELMQVETQLGSIESGKLADIVAVKGDPLSDIALLTDIDFVMKGGKVYKHK